MAPPLAREPQVTYGDVPGYNKGEETAWSPVEMVTVLDEGEWRIASANF